MVKVVTFPPKYGRRRKPNIDKRIMEVMSKYASHNSHVVKTDIKWTCLSFESSILPYAALLGVPAENDLFGPLDMRGISAQRSSISLASILAYAEEFHEKEMYVTAICICPDGWVLFGRSMDENN